ncbi:MAG: hypothetical protein RR313_04430 [Anaerovoracaceae bacterium]
MRKLNYFSSIALVIVMPLAILIIVSTLTLRLPAVYQFHFNDSQVLNEIPYNISGDQMSSEIAGYFSSFSSDNFQVYEDNGIYQDPVFDLLDVEAMGKARIVGNIGMGIGFACLLLVVGIYIILIKNGYKLALRSRYKIVLPISLALLILQVILVSKGSIRTWLYSNLIGVKLAKDSILNIVLGGAFFHTYILFSILIGVVVIGLISYITFRLTKPPRIFY